MTLPVIVFIVQVVTAVISIGIALFLYAKDEYSHATYFMVMGMAFLIMSGQ